MYLSRGMRLFALCALLVTAPGFAFGTEDPNGMVLTSKKYVLDELDNKQDKITYSATNKVVITPTVDGGATGERNIATAGTGITDLANSSATGADYIPTAYAVKEAIGTATTGMITDVSGKQNKPNATGATAAAGKVLMYGGNSFDTDVTAAYVKVPVASGDPNAANASTPTSFVSIWVE